LIKELKTNVGQFGVAKSNAGNITKNTRAVLKAWKENCNETK